LGLFSQSGSGNQNPFLSSYTTDIKAVENDIAAMLANPGNVTLGGATFTLNTNDTAVLTNVESQLTTLLTAAAQTTNAATMSAADQTIHALQNEILQENQRRRPSISRPQPSHAHGYYWRDRRRVPERSGH
jgi:trimeric autotransporter adhesin